MRKKLIALVLGFSLYSQLAMSQQDSQYTQYMYNTMSFNPAYTGTRGSFSAIALYRNQWVGIDGAPETLNFSMQAPVGKKVGLGVNVSSDKVFVVNETSIDFAFSYQVDVSDESKISLGLKAGLNFFDVNFSRAYVGPSEDLDPNLYNVENKASPQFGVGAFYYNDNFYTGLSVPNVLGINHYSDVQKNVKSERLHLYYIIGNVFELNPDLKFKPSGLVKMVSGSPLQVDVSANLLFYDKLTLGVAYRWDAAVSGMAGFQISDRWLIGYAYDWETTRLSRYNSGSHEIFLRFELLSRRSRILSPRFF